MTQQNNQPLPSGAEDTIERIEAMLEQARRGMVPNFAAGRALIHAPTPIAASMHIIQPIEQTDHANTIEGLQALLTLARNPRRRALGVVFAVVWEDRTTDFGRLGQMQRSREKAFLAASQLADSLLWD